MPAYEYRCEACEHHFDVRQKMSDRALELCPQCGGALHRLISGGAGAITNGGAAPAPACGMGGCGMREASGGCCGGMCAH